MSLNESLGDTPLNASLRAGIATLSASQTIKFTKYVRLVLPMDGFVFWLKANLVSPSAIFNASKFNTSAINQAQTIIEGVPTIDVQGSFHYSTDQKQLEDETPAVNHVIFTTSDYVQDFEQIGSNVLFIGEFEGIRFAFTRHGRYYEQANLFHYSGDAIFPAMESQIIDDARSFDTRNVVVSNSLPIWLGLNEFMPMYPSFLVDANLPPPYAAVHIDPNSTNAIQAVPSIDSEGTHTQLVTEKVKITMYGLRNFNALDFQDYVFQYSLNTDIIGVMNMPVIRDEKRVQSELNILAMKKSIEFEISYYQTRVNKIARQLITQALITFTPFTLGE